MTEPSSSSAALSLWLDLSSPLPDPGVAVPETLEDDELHAEGLVARREPAEPRDAKPAPEEPLDLIERHARERLRAWVVGAPSVSPQVGRFTLLRRLGEGGMGTVYAAYDDELDRKVALKFLHPAKANDRSAQHRLLREAQALARLSHPNLVTVFDVGRHEGQVYLAMELVAGRTMRVWVEEQAPPWRAVLEAWICVGRALVVVHAEGLVHRDVKPDNVIVGNDGRTRLVDFGLAREVGEATSRPDLEMGLTARESHSGSGPRLRETITRSRAVVGTPAYLAPEQRMGEPAGPAADQYGFCVSLYEGLYGCRPPGPVSEGLVRVPEAAAVPIAVRRALSRGLSMDPRARFPTMESLLAALERPLARRRIGSLVAGGAAAVAALAVAASWARPPAAAAVMPCASAGSEIEAVWNDGARAELERTGQLGAQPVLQAFASEWSTVRREVCEATRVVGVQSEAALDRRVACLDRQRDRFAAVVPDPELGDANVLAGLAELPAPRDCTLPGVAEAAGEPPPPQLRGEIAAVHASLARAGQRAIDGRVDAARAEAAAALAAAQTLGYEPLIAAALLTVGAVERHDFRAEPARAALERAIDLAEANGELGLKEEALGQLVRLAIDVEVDLEQAVGAWHRNAATLRRLGVSRDRSAGLLASLGLIQRLGGRLVEAEISLRAADSLDQAQGLRAAPRRASNLRNLGNVLADQGRAAEATEVFEHARALDARNPDGSAIWQTTARGDAALAEGHALLMQGKRVEARRRLEHALAEYRDAFGPHSTQTADAHVMLAQLAIDEGRVEEARRHAEAADLAFRLSVGLEHPDRVIPLSALGTVAYEQGRGEAAVQAFDAAMLLAERSEPAHSLGLAQHRSNLAEALLLVGRTRRARALAEQALAVMESGLAPGHVDLAFPLRALGEALLREDEGDRAVTLLGQALALHEAQPSYPAERARTRAWLARAQLATGDEASARDQARLAAVELDALGPTYAADAAAMREIARQTSTVNPRSGDPAP